MAAETSPATPKPLPTELREQMERAFDVDFSEVRVHPEASASATNGAAAFTKGVDIYIAPGRYNPGSTEGRELIAHELTHVVQQRTGIQNPDSDSASDAEADQCAKLAASGQPVQMRAKK